MELFIYGHSTGDAYRLEHCFSDRLLESLLAGEIGLEDMERLGRLTGKIGEKILGPVHANTPNYVVSIPIVQKKCVYTVN